MSTAEIVISDDPDASGNYHGLYIDGLREMPFRLEPDGPQWRIVDAADGVALATVSAGPGWPIREIAEAMRAKLKS